MVYLRLKELIEFPGYYYNASLPEQEILGGIAGILQLHDEIRESRHNQKQYQTKSILIAIESLKKDLPEYAKKAAGYLEASKVEDLKIEQLRQEEEGITQDLKVMLNNPLLRKTYAGSLAKSYLDKVIQIKNLPKNVFPFY